MFFEPSDAAFDSIAFFILQLVEAAITLTLSLLVSPLGDHRYKAMATANASYSLGVISFVRDQQRKALSPRQSVHPLQKGGKAGFECRKVIDVACRQDEAERVAALVANQVKLGGEASAGAAERLAFLLFLDGLSFVFFGAPAACR